MMIEHNIHDSAVPVFGSAQLRMDGSANPDSTIECVVEGVSLMQFFISRWCRNK
jgi:hypothetical protein